jgi:hypothetical protein
MKINAVKFTIALCLISFAQSANAGFTSLYVSPSPGSTLPAPDYYTDLGTGTLDIDETWTALHGSQYSFDVWGTTDSDPPLHIIKEVTNGTDLTWLGYKLDLSLAEPHTFELISPAPSSDTMTLVSATPKSLEFGVPSPVGPGDTVTFDFVVNVVAIGGFSFTLTQSPIVPEPATCGLVTLGAALLAAMVRRRF